MSEAVEYRIANLKTVLGYAISAMVALFAVTIFAVNNTLESPQLGLIGLALALYAALLVTVVRARETDGYCRKFANRLPTMEMEVRPTKSWKKSLENRGELSGGVDDK